MAYTSRVLAARVPADRRAEYAQAVRTCTCLPCRWRRWLTLRGLR